MSIPVTDTEGPNVGNSVLLSMIPNSWPDLLPLFSWVTEFGLTLFTFHLIHYIFVYSVHMVLLFVHNVTLTVLLLISHMAPAACLSWERGL